jgi:hypothetical protein
MKTEIKLSPLRNDADRLYADGVLMLDAVGGEITAGLFKGLHIFSSREKAEELCRKYSITVTFDAPEQSA